MKRKKYIFPILLGELFFVLYILLQNVFSINPSFWLTFSTLLVCGLSLYAYVYLTLKQSKVLNYYVFKGFIQAFLIFSITFGINTVIKTIFFNNKIETGNPSPHVEIIAHYKDSTLCYLNKYGTFLVDDRDTLIRFKRENVDFEKLVSNGTTNEFIIKWMDSCSYLRVNKTSKILENRIEIVRFYDTFHTIRIIPNALNRDNTMEVNVIKLE